jgi:histidinol-phosphate phosphatase family protein
MKQAVIACGGLGTRLTEKGIMTPKCLLEVNGVTILERQIEVLQHSGITKILLLLGSQSHEISSRLPNLSVDAQIEIETLVESRKMGTGGALVNALHRLDESFLYVYGDIYLDCNLTPLVNSVSTGIEVGILTRASDHMQDSNLVSVGMDDEICGFHLKPHPVGLYPRNIAMTGLYAFKKSSVTRLSVEFHSTFDLDSEGLPHLLGAGCKMEIVRNNGLVKDIGTMDRISSVTGEESITQGTMARPCIFLDRDGVINRPNGHISSIEEFELLPEVPEAIALIRRKGFRTIVVTNQPGIARGDFNWQNLESIHGFFEEKLAKKRALVDAIYVCPHHPERGFPGEVPKFKIVCECRKPKSGLFLRAFRDFPTVISQSWMVGDQISDREAAKHVGLNFAALPNLDPLHWTNSQEKPFENLMEFAKSLAPFEPKVELYDHY